MTEDIEALKCEVAKQFYGHDDDKWSLPYADHALIDFLHRTGRLNTVPVPEGWKLVPVEPTPYMLRSIAVVLMAGADEIDHESIDEEIPALCHKAMLSAAPELPKLEADMKAAQEREG
jgi:hypothetical protein